MKKIRGKKKETAGLERALRRFEIWETVSFVLNDISQLGLGLDIPTPHFTSSSTTVGSRVEEDFSKNKIIIKIKIWVFFVVFL